MCDGGTQKDLKDKVGKVGREVPNLTIEAHRENMAVASEHTRLPSNNFRMRWRGTLDST